MSGDVKTTGPESRIDENFRHVQTPRSVVQAGRPDIDGDDRPGPKFVAAVRDFAAEGGFDRMREERTAPVPASKLTVAGPVAKGTIRDFSPGSDRNLDVDADGSDD